MEKNDRRMANAQNQICVTDIHTGYACIKKLEPVPVFDSSCQIPENYCL